MYFNKLVKNDKLLVANLYHVNSSCISFTNLASRKTDTLITASSNPWDIMPGMLICKECGIKTYSLNFNGKLKLFTKNDIIKKLLLSKKSHPHKQSCLWGFSLI